MQNDITQRFPLHLLRHEVRAARLAGARAPQHPVFVEDIIIARLLETQENLAVAAGLFKELGEDKTSPFLKYGSRLSEALDIVQDTLHLRNPGLYE